MFYVGYIRNMHIKVNRRPSVEHGCECVTCDQLHVFPETSGYKASWITDEMTDLTDLTLNGLCGVCMLVLWLCEFFFYRYSGTFTDQKHAKLG